MIHRRHNATATNISVHNKSVHTLIQTRPVDISSSLPSSAASSSLGNSRTLFLFLTSTSDLADDPLAGFSEIVTLQYRHTVLVRVYYIPSSIDTFRCFFWRLDFTLLLWYITSNKYLKNNNNNNNKIETKS